MLENMLTNKTDNSYNERLLFEIKNSNVPTILYGGGGYALKVIDYLSAHSVPRSCCVIDDRYYTAGKLCGSLPVICYSKFEDKYSACNVVYAINTFSEKFPAKETVKKILAKTGRRVFFFELEYLFGETSEKEMPQEYLRAHIGDFERTYNLLSDNESRNVFLSYLRAKTGIINAPKIPRISELWTEEQYFNTVLQKSDLPNVQEVFVDCGAFDGDTVENFASHFSDYKKIIAFEPDAKNYEKLAQKQNGIKSLMCVKKGVWDKETELCFISDGTSAARVTESNEKSVDSVSVTSVDAVLRGNPAAFIKMDIEGSELKALHGCSETIKKYMPLLAVCVYHKRSDLIDIPNYIDSLAIQNEEYRYDYYLRHHSYFTDELVLYAVPKKRSA